MEALVATILNPEEPVKYCLKQKKSQKSYVFIPIKLFLKHYYVF